MFPPLRFVGLAVIALAQLTFGSAASAQSSDPVLHLSTQSFNEVLLPTNTPRTRATPDGTDPLRTIVAIHYGHSHGNFEITNLGAFLRGSTTRQNFCVSIQSSDGRYSATNLYYNSSDPQARRTIETRSSHGAELSRTFEADDVAVRIIANATCNNVRTGQFVAALPPGYDGSGLVAYLNAEDVMSFRLLTGDKVVAEASCDRVASRVRTFSHICNIPIKGINGQPETIEVRTRTGSRLVSSRYPLLWVAP